MKKSLSSVLEVPISRRAFYGTGALLGSGAFGYGSLIERRRPVIERVSCPVAERFGFLEGLTVAVLSDFHHDEFRDEDLMAAAVAKTNALDPDLVMLPGDFISHDIAGLEPLSRHLAELRARLGVFAVLGNHDHWTGKVDPIIRKLEGIGVRTLRNESAILKTASGERFALGGLESAWAGFPDYDAVEKGTGSGTPILLGWHEPDPFDQIEDPRMVLQMSGHTHGGQVCAPFFGPIRLPHLGKKYPSGLFRHPSGEGSLYVTRGIGAMGVPVRFCCPPEISLIKFRTAA